MEARDGRGREAGLKTWAELGIIVPSGATGEFDTICPECGGTKRSKRENQRDKDLSGNLLTGTYCCHHCEFKGSLGINTIPVSHRTKVYTRPRDLPKPTPTATTRMMQFFASRKISAPVVERNRITAIDQGKGEWIAFPYYRDGEHINTTYRGLPDKKFRQEKDAERIFWGLDDITPETTEVIICEGQIDKLSFEMAAYRTCLSVPDGAPPAGTKDYTSKLTYLESATPLFERMTRVYLACDADANGRALNEELGRRIGREKCRVVRWPDGCKDANDTLVQHGPEAIRHAIHRAAPFPVEGITYGDELLDRVKALRDGGIDPGLRLGLPLLDTCYRVRPGLITVLTGHSFHGKSMWLDHIMIRLATLHDWRFAIFSPENQPLELHYAHLLEAYLRKPFERQYSGSMADEDIDASAQFMHDHFVFLQADTSDLDSVLERARIVNFQHGINGLVIDPWNEVNHGMYENLTETQYVSRGLARIRQFGRDHSLHIWVCAHPKGMPRDKDGVEVVPTIGDIAGSVHFRNKADYGVSIWRSLDPEKQKEPSQCHIQKVRFRETGHLGTVLFEYDWPTRTMKEARP